MKRYPIGAIQPDWRIPAPTDPIIRGASDRTGFGALSNCTLTIYRLKTPLPGNTTSIEICKSVPLANAKLYALGPDVKALAVAEGPIIELSVEGIGSLGPLSVGPGEVSAVAISASGRTLWAVVSIPEGNQPRLHAWDLPSLRSLGDVKVLGPQGSSFDLVVHPDQNMERVGVDAAAGQDGSSFTFVDRINTKLQLLTGSHDADDGIALGGLSGDEALLIAREAIVTIGVQTADRAHGPSRATLPGMKDEFIFDYQRADLADYWAISGRFDDRDPDEVAESPPEDASEGRLRFYDAHLIEIFEMPSTDDLYDTPWAVVGLAGHRVLVCQSDALMLYNLHSLLQP